MNLTRPRAVLSLLLTLGVPAALAVVAVLRGRAELSLGRPHFRFFAAGAAIAGLLYIYSLVGAWADGRVVWIIYPFLIPIALTVWWSPVSSRSTSPAASH